MRKFYLFQKGQTVSAKLSWSHYSEILGFDRTKYIYYIKIIEEKRLSVRQLREKIKNKDYERLPESTKYKLIENEETKLPDLLPNPIIIRNKSNYEVISEKNITKDDYGRYIIFLKRTR